MTTETDLQEQLRMLQKGFAAKLPGRIDAMEQAMRQWIADSDMSELRALHRLLHSLAGAAGTFGFAAAGEEARRLEKVVASWLNGGRFAMDDIDALAASLHRLRSDTASISMR